MRQLALLGLFFFGFFAPQLATAAPSSRAMAPSSTITITATVPLSLTQQFLIQKNSEVRLVEPFGSPDSWLLKIELKGLAGQPQANHRLTYELLDQDQRSLRQADFSTDNQGRGKLKISFDSQTISAALVVRDQTFAPGFVVTNIPLFYPLSSRNQRLLTAIIRGKEVPTPTFGYEGQKTNLGSNTAAGRPGLLLASLVR